MKELIIKSEKLDSSGDHKKSDLLMFKLSQEEDNGEDYLDKMMVYPNLPIEHSNYEIDLNEIITQDQPDNFSSDLFLINLFLKSIAKYLDVSIIELENVLKTLTKKHNIIDLIPHKLLYEFMVEIADETVKRIEQKFPGWSPILSGITTKEVTLPNERLQYYLDSILQYNFISDHFKLFINFIKIKRTENEFLNLKNKFRNSIFEKISPKRNSSFLANKNSKAFMVIKAPDEYLSLNSLSFIFDFEMVFIKNKSNKLNPLKRKEYLDNFNDLSMRAIKVHQLEDESSSLIIPTSIFLTFEIRWIPTLNSSSISLSELQEPGFKKGISLSVPENLEE